MIIENFFDICIQRQASDLHIIPGFFPTIRINNNITQLRVSDIISEEESKNITLSLLNDQQKEILLSNKQLDFAYQYKDYRFRCNAYFTKNNLALAIRLLDSTIRTIEELNLPPLFHKLTDYNQGLVLITGPTGQGKSTSLASLINEINLKKNKHIITIEDPIEYVYPPGRSIISQRELYQDTHSWPNALKAALREDPDVVLIGEMRDYDSVQLALTIAETGHLVYSTLHTGTAAETISRIIDIFPAEQQTQIKMQLSSVLKAVIAQRLIPTLNNASRIPAVEILFNNPAVATIIREGRFELLPNVMTTSETEGMILFERYLISLLEKGLISKEIAVSYAFRPKELEKLLK